MDAIRNQTILLSAIVFALAAALPVWTVPVVGQAPTASASANTAPPGATQTDDAPKKAADGAEDVEAMDRKMAEVAETFPAKTEGKGAQELEPKILEDGTKQFVLTTQLTDWEVSPGKVVKAMSYNGTVPGPTLRVNVGDKVRVVLKNEMPQSTTIHWHGIPIQNAMDGVGDITQPAVKSGDSFTYEITAERQSVGWYHSHHSGTKQVGDGLWGAFLIGDLPLPGNVKADQEKTIQLQDSGAIGLSLNGKSFPATEPIRAKKGESVLIHYFNAGAQIHPMHLHGVDQLVVGKDGFPLQQPYKADTVLVGPGERYSVLVQADRLGSWAFHCHIFPHSEGKDGMFGMFTEFIIK